MQSSKCLECYPDQPRCWRDAPMNEEIRKVLTWSRHANVYYYTLDDAMSVWGTQIDEEFDDE